MTSARVRAVIVIGLVLTWHACARALNPSLDVSQYAHTAWNLRDGFVKGSILSIAQTPDGYLWLGTEFGLVRFDGVHAVAWQPPPGQQLPGSAVRSLLVARDGTLWIGTNKGLASWNEGLLKIYPELSQPITALIQDRNGTIWVGTIELPSAGKLCAVRSGGVQCQGGGGVFGVGVLACYEDSKGNLWLGVQNGFWRWQPGHSEFFPVPKEIGGIADFAEDRGTLLISTSKGLQRFVDGRVEAYPLPGLSRPVRPIRLLRDHDGGLWVATNDNGVVHVHDDKVDEFSQATGLSGDNVSSLFEDREGNIWVATIDGLDRFLDYAIPIVSTKQGLSNGTVISVLAAKDGSVWIATFNGLNRWQGGQISVFGNRSGTAHSGEKLNGWHPESLFQDSRGRIWVSTSHEFGYLENDRFIPLRALPSGYVHDLTEVGQGHLWVAHQQAGLFHIFQGNVIEHFPWAGLGHKDFSFVMAPDPAHRGLWLGFFEGGVAYFSDGKIQKAYSAAEGLGKGWVTGLRVDPSGALWASTQGGLSRIKDGHVSTLSSRSGLPCDAVHWSMEDDDNSVWLYMSCGLARIARSDLDSWVADPTSTIKITFFGLTDNVPSHYSQGGYARNVAKAPDGKLWFIEWDGVGIIDPHHLPFNKIPPPVHIEQITADGKTYNVSSAANASTNLPAHVRDLAIDYTALSLVAPGKIHFRYELEGQDPNWREVVNDRHVQYSNLPPKHYRFHVTASNNDGVWNEEGATLDFVITPAWYQTSWFRLLCLSGLLVLIWAVYQLRFHQLQRQFNMKLEERVNERTRIARELHDTLLQSFQGQLMRFQAVSNQLAEGRPKQELDETIDRAAQAITEARDAVQGLRSSVVESNDLAAAIGTLGKELAAADSRPPEFAMQVEGAPRSLHPILRDEVYRVAGEALRNAFRHANARRIEVEIRYDERQFRLRVRDDGKGIDPKLLVGNGRPGHFGLPGMRERAQRAGGKLTVWSQLESGTEIELRIPAAHAYTRFPASRRRWLRMKFSEKDHEMKL